MTVYFQRIIPDGDEFIAEIELADDSYFSKRFQSYDAAVEGLNIILKQVEGVVIARSDILE